MSESAIRETFGPLFAEFDQALRSDPWLLVQIVERMAERRRMRDERRYPAAARDREILARWRAGGATHRQIADEFGMTPSGIRGILARHADTHM